MRALSWSVRFLCARPAPKYLLVNLKLILKADTLRSTLPRQMS
jgi:hypothetical protein